MGNRTRLSRSFFYCGAALAALLASGCEAEPEPEVVVVEPTDLDRTTYPISANRAAPWDANGDGLIQEAEYENLSGEGGEAWDTNGDGRLDPQEFGIKWSEIGFNNSEQAFDRWDADGDGDGVLSNDEFFGSDDWSDWDRDQSGTLEAAEFSYY